MKNNVNLQLFSLFKTVAILEQQVAITTYSRPRETHLSFLSSHARWSCLTYITFRPLEAKKKTPQKTKHIQRYIW